ncbi:MAG: PorV/PorQ family protein [Calditrichae bacterium]|nr:PorV/PorQ family protein [Calditrichota bacterium]MCB9058523.1 PorV/PorQ family protein [Calditrichia bacterium]
MSAFKKIIFLFLSLLTVTVYGQEKLAQTGFQFLSVSPTGKAAALGDAFTAINSGSSALLFNPAGLALMDGFLDVSGSYNDFIADIQYQSMTLAIAPEGGQYGVFGLSFLWIDYGEFLGTMFWNNDKGFIDTEKFSPQAMAIGLGYGKSLTDKFSVGGQVKYVVQSSGESVIPSSSSSSGLAVKKYVVEALAFDFGTIYETGFKSLAFGMSIRNFSEEIKFEQEGFQLPLTFRIGVAMNMVDFLPSYADDNSLYLSIDAVHPRAQDEFVAFGLDYTFMNTFSVRLGYASGQDEYDLSYGLGIKKFGLSFDYAYIPFGVFSDVQKISFSYSM